MKIFGGFLLLCVCLSLQAKIYPKSEDFWVLTNLEPPFSQVDERGKLNGYLIDLVKNILHEAGIKQKILAAPWARVLKEGKEKSNVLVFAVTRTPERENDYHWISPMTANIYGVYSLQSGAAKINSLQDLGSHGTVGVLEGDFRHELLLSINKNNVQAYPDWASVVEALLAGQVKSAFFSDAGIEYYCKKNAWDCKEIQRLYIYKKNTTYLVLSKPGTNQALVKTLSDAALRYKKSDDYKRLSNTWLAHYRDMNELTMHEADGIVNLWPGPE